MKPGEHRGTDALIVDGALGASVGAACGAVAGVVIEWLGWSIGHATPAVGMMIGTGIGLSAKLFFFKQTHTTSHSSETIQVEIRGNVMILRIFESVGITTNLLHSGMVYFSSMLAGTLLLLPGGIVVTDSSMVGLLLRYNIDFSSASIAVIITRFITLWFTVIIGLISLKLVLAYSKFFSKN